MLHAASEKERNQHFTTQNVCFSYQEGILFKCSDRGLRKTILPHGDKFLTRLKADKREESKEIRAMTEKPKRLSRHAGVFSATSPS